MSVSRVFTYRGLAVSVETSESAALAWLEEFLIPAFAVVEGIAPACYVALEDDERAYEEALRHTSRVESEPIACFALDGGPIRLPSWRWSAEERVIFDGDSQVFYLVNRDSSRIRILADRPWASRRIALMRVVRELATSHVWGGESLIVHGAAVAVGGRGLLIAGPKGAGKTSVLLHLLLNQPGTRFVSNDRVVVDFEPATILRGMPTVATIKEHTLGLFPGLEARLCQRNYDARLALGELKHGLASSVRGTEGRVGLAPAQLCAVVDAEMLGDAPAGALLLPRVSQDEEGIHVTPLSPRIAAAALRTHLVGGAVPAVSQAFGVTRQCHRGVDPAKLDRLSVAFAEQSRCFECRLGRNAYRPETAARLVERVLDR